MSIQAVCLLIAPLAAQQTHRVTGSGAALANAVAAATTGDTVEVLSSGPFLPFTITKGLVIVGSSFTVQPDPVQGAANLVVDVPPSETLIVRGCWFQRVPTSAVSYRGRVEVRRGRVFFESFAFDTAGHGLVVLGGEVGLLGGRIRSLEDNNAGSVDGSALVVESGTVLASFSEFHARPTNPPFIASAPGVEIRNTGRLHAQSITVQGGAGMAGFGAMPAIRVRDTARAWLVAATLRAGSGFTAIPPNGAPALSVAPSAAAEIARCSLHADIGTPPTEGPVVLDAPLLGVTPLTSLGIGGTWTLVCEARPREPLAAFLSFELSASHWAGAAQPIWLPNTGSVFLAGGVADASGSLRFAVPIPANLHLLRRPLFFHAVGAAQTPLQISVPIGGLM